MSKYNEKIEDKFIINYNAKTIIFHGILKWNK